VCALCLRNALAANGSVCFGPKLIRRSNQAPVERAPAASFAASPHSRKLTKTLAKKSVQKSLLIVKIDAWDILSHSSVRCRKVLKMKSDLV
jgi:hypothetical protein